MNYILISQKMINDSIPCDLRRCVLALALRIKYAKTDVGVYGKYAYVENMHFEIPYDTRRYVSRFDRGNKVFPCVLPIRPIEYSIHIAREAKRYGIIFPRKEE